MKLIWRESARADLKQLTAFVADYNPQAAGELGDRIERLAERLADHPYMYRSGRVPGTREAVAHP